MQVELPADTTTQEHRLAKLSAFDLDSSFRSVFTLDLEFDITDQQLDERGPLLGVLLPGEWFWEVSREDDEVVVSLAHGDLSLGTFGNRVQWSVRVVAVASGRGWLLGETTSASHKPRSEPHELEEGEAEVEGISDGYAILIDQEDIDNVVRQSKGAYDPSAHRLYRFIFEIWQRQATTTEEANTLIKRMPALELAPTPYDVRIFFPRVSKEGAELWTDTCTLSKASPYLETLLKSDFAETATTSRKRPRTRASRDLPPLSLAALNPISSDSDEETDEAYFEEHPPVLHEHEGDCPLEYKQINVTGSSFTTYRAVLAYLRTGYIDFAPLSSKFKPKSATAISTRTQYLRRFRERKSPYPVSPKSTYRLAHFLDLEELQHSCLVALRRGLTAENACVELVDDTSVLYDDWRKVVLDYVIAHWDKVIETNRWKEIQASVERGEQPQTAPIFLQLAMSRATPQTKP